MDDEKAKSVHDAVFDGAAVLSHNAGDLRSLARALARAGNPTVATELTMIANIIEEVGEEIMHAYSADLHRRVGEANEGLERMRNLALAMVPYIGEPRA